MRNTLEARLDDLDARIEALDNQRDGYDSVETTSLLEDLRRERSDVADALRDAVLVDDEPFDTEAIEIGDTVTVRAEDGAIERYVLVDGNVGTRARSDWVSASSPLGAALLGRNNGARVRVESPAGSAYYTIVAFERSSEDATFIDPGSGRRLSRALQLLPSDTFLG
jgi:transcription elongation GreA/GreB family factor